MVIVPFPGPEVHQVKLSELPPATQGGKYRPFAGSLPCGDTQTLHQTGFRNQQRRQKMAVFKCEKCGATKEGRCKPKKCGSCGESGCMSKQEEAAAAPCKRCGCKVKK